MMRASLVWGLWICGILTTFGAYADTCSSTSYVQKYASCTGLEGLSKRVEAFLNSNAIPSLSVAYGIGGKLAFARAYGAADAVKGSRACTNSLYRVASVSKALTATAVMKLVEQGRLSLSSKVFGPGAILGTKYGSQQPYVQNIRDITLQQLLEHTAGGKVWSNMPPDGTDKTFERPELDRAGVIGWYLDEFPPSEKPGSIYAYSNIGYAVLGRVIEQATNTTYEEWLRQNLFAPAGAMSLRIGGDKVADALPNEVVYGTKDDQEAPYAFPFGRGDSDGGWVSTASDLVRVGLTLDSNPATPDILKSATLSTMFMKSAASVAAGDDYAKGWSIDDKGNPWHQGNLDGTIALLSIEKSSGAVYAMVMNGSGKDGTIDDVSALANEILDIARKC